jgi:ligand-binding SRPBCC domain-containing protein
MPNHDRPSAEHPAETLRKHCSFCDTIATEMRHKQEWKKAHRFSNEVKQTDSKEGHSADCPI